MESPGSDPEETRQGEAQEYHLENFDPPSGEYSLPAPRLTSPRDQFQSGVDLDSREAAPFDGGATAPSPEQDFSSIKFQRENTLLTNAESYANSIREEAQLYVQQLRGEVESLNEQAEKRYEESLSLKEEAESEAQRLISQAEAEVEKIRSQAHQEGYELGREEGMTRRYEETGKYLEQMESILKEIHQFRRRVAYYTEKDGVRLALLIAKKVLHSELKINRQAVLKLVASTLAKQEGQGTFQIWLSEMDYDFILKARPSLERFMGEKQILSLRAKPDLPPGNVLIETDREVIDLTFESQFHHLEQKLYQTLATREAVLEQRPSGYPPRSSAQEPAPQEPSPPAPESPSGTQGDEA